MRSVSKKQHNLMAAVANNPKFAKKVGISKSVGEEFMKADKTKKFGSGGSLKATDSIPYELFKVVDATNLQSAASVT